MLNKSIKSFLFFLLFILWPRYMKGGNQHAIFIVFKCFIIQKLLRINGKVNWPVHPTSKISAPDLILRGSRTPGLAQGCHIDGRNGIIFGENVWVGPHVKIISMNHDTCSYNGYIKTSPIKIGDNCWIGAGAIILPAVELGDHTIVGAGAVVTKSFPGTDQIIAGNPAKIVKKLLPYRQ